MQAMGFIYYSSSGQTIAWNYLRMMIDWSGNKPISCVVVISGYKSTPKALHYKYVSNGPIRRICIYLQIIYVNI